jgi:hypothetical protein
MSVERTSSACSAEAYHQGGPPQANTNTPGNWLSLATLAILSLMVAAYAGLIPLGQWQSDEYEVFARLRQAFVPAMAERLHWSPRPLSESLFAIYGLLVNRLRHPLTGPFLTLLWATLFLAAFTPALTRQSPGRQNLQNDVLIGMGLLAAFLTARPIFEIFYWPAAAVAYLPTLAATLLLFLQALYGRLSTSHGHGLACFCLSVTALSSEMGAIFTLCFAALQLFHQRRHIASETGVGPRVLWWFFPAFFACAVVATVALQRMQTHEVFRPSATLGHVVPSGIAAARTLALELLGFGGTVHRFSGGLVRLASKMLTAVGIAILWMQARASRPQSPLSNQSPLLLTSMALLSASYITIALSYFHFGEPLGERYETLRRCWNLLVLCALAVWLLNSTPMSTLRMRVQAWKTAPLLLLAGVLLGWHPGSLIGEYSVYRQVAACVQQNFVSGFAADSRKIVFINPPNRGVITAATLPIGTYTPDGPLTPFNYAANILKYFGKDTLIAHDAGGPDATLEPCRSATPNALTFPQHQRIFHTP